MSHIFCSSHAELPASDGNHNLNFLTQKQATWSSLHVKHLAPVRIKEASQSTSEMKQHGWFTLLVCHWFTGYRGALPSQWKAVYFRYEDNLSVGHQAAEGQPGGGSQPCGVCGYKGHQVHFAVLLLSLKSYSLKDEASTYNTHCWCYSELHGRCHNITPCPCVPNAFSTLWIMNEWGPTLAKFKGRYLNVSLGTVKLKCSNIIMMITALLSVVSSLDIQYD